MWFELVERHQAPRFAMLRAQPGHVGADRLRRWRWRSAAATIGFAFADLALFRGLPVDDNSKVVSIFVSDTHGSNFRARVSAPDLLDYRARTTTLEQLSAMRDGRAALITQRPVANADGQPTPPPTCLPRWGRRRSPDACSLTATMPPGARAGRGAVAPLLARRDGQPRRCDRPHAADRPRDRHGRRRALAGHRVRQPRRDRSLAAADAGPRRSARCQEPALHRRGCATA